MSVLVKGMKMPVSCYECPMAEEMDMQEDWHKCKLLNKEFYSWDVTDDMKEYHRPKECPLVEVPTPHGRLIDAEALKETVCIHDYILKDRFNSTDKGMFTLGIMYAINQQPTVDAIPVDYMRLQIDCEKWEEIITRWKEHDHKAD